MNIRIFAGLLCVVVSVQAAPKPVLELNVDLPKWFAAQEPTNEVAVVLAAMGASRLSAGVYVEEGAIVPVARLSASRPQAAALFLSNTNGAGMTKVSASEFKWTPGKKAAVATGLLGMGEPLIRIADDAVLAGPELKLGFAESLNGSLADDDVVRANVDLKPLVDPFLAAVKAFVDEQAEGMAKGIMGSMVATLEKTLRGSGELPSLGVRIAETASKDRSMALALRYSSAGIAAKNKSFFADSSNAWKNPEITKQELAACQLAESPFFQTLELDGDRLLFNYVWNPTNDAAMLESVGKPIASSLFSFSNHSSFPVRETATIDAPEFESLEHFDAASFESDFRSALFYDTSWGTSVSLELDWMDIPNPDFLKTSVSNLCILTAEGEDIADTKRPSRLQVDPKRKSARLQLPAQKDKPEAVTASFDIRFEMPGSFRTYELSAERPFVEINGGGLCLINLSNSVAHIRSQHVSLSEAKVYGVDGAGNYLKQSGASWSESFHRGEYYGAPEKVVVAFAEDPVSFTIRYSDFPVTKESKLKLPNEPTNGVPVRYSFEPAKEYRNPDLEAVAAGGMSYTTTGGWRKNSCCLLFPEPEEVKMVNLSLKTWLAGSDKLAFHGQDSGRSSSGGNFMWELKDTNALAAASAIFGEAELKMRAGIETYEIDLTTNAVAFIQDELPTIRVEKNVVWIRAGQDAEVLNLLAYDSSGRQLKKSGRSMFRNNERGACFWGAPVRAQITYASTTETVMIPFEIALKEGGLAAVSEVRKKAEAFDGLVDEFKEIEKTSRSYGNLLAANYYKVNYRGEPEAKVLKAVADSDPVGAELFGYEPTPYKGYFLQYVPSDRDVGKEHKTYTHKWSGGEFAAPSYNGLFLAVATEAGQPSILFRWNDVFVNYADCSGLDEMTTDQKQLEAAGWIKIR